MPKLMIVDTPWWKLGASVDQHGQPLNTAFNHHQNVIKAADELIGICKGLLVDGAIDDDEAELLRRWIRDHPNVAREWPVREVAARVNAIFADGKIDDQERSDLAVLLQLLVGGAEEETTAGATRLPLDDPPPAVVFRDSAFVVTGKFVYGQRDKVLGCIITRGGVVQKNVTMATRCLLIGALASRDWAHASYGRKIEKAVQYRDKGVPIKIVSEEHWVRFL
jgi:NAD-dependent DNA ligase